MIGHELGVLMLAEELLVLADTSAVTLVAAMTTDAWQAVRSGVGRLFGQLGADRQHGVEAQMDGNAELVARAVDVDRARESLVGLWRLELESLLSQHPEAAASLRELMDTARAALPAAQQSWVQTNVAYGGTIYAAQGGNVIMHGASAPVGSENSDSISDGR
jgi:hypothetical protein